MYKSHGFCPISVGAIQDWAVGDASFIFPTSVSETPIVVWLVQNKLGGCMDCDSVFICPCACSHPERLTGQPHQTHSIAFGSASNALCIGRIMELVKGLCEGSRAGGGWTEVELQLTICK